MEGFKAPRKLRVARMESWGEHLSACKNVLDLLKVSYDAVLTHWRLCNCDLLHRDISWGNVLCKPVHGRNLIVGSGEEDQLGGLWIEKIIGNPSGLPCALLTGFDHVVKMETLKGEDCQPRTDTSMFISVNLASNRQMARRIDISLDLQSLKRQLVSAQLHCGPFFKRAFPDDSRNSAFLEQFMKVANDEREKYDKEEPSSTEINPKHRPFHDIESFYWVFLWSFVRAQPKGGESESGLHRAYDSFCRTMITHIPGEEEERSNFLFIPGLNQTLLHPQLSRFSRLLGVMSCYLSMRWNEHEDISPDHAHMAFLRLLLMEICDIRTNRASNVEFEDSPRPFRTSGVIKASLLTHSASSTTHKRRINERDEGISNPKKPRIQAPETRQDSEFAGRRVFAACQEMTAEMKLNLGANRR